MDSHVSTVALHVRAPASVLGGAAPAAERFARQVLARCDARLEARRPGAVFVMRELELSLRLFDCMLDDPGEIDIVADAITEHIVALASGASPIAAESANDDVVAVFDDEIEWRAGHLEAWAGGSQRRSWAFAALDTAGEPLATLTDPVHRDRLRDIITRLHRRGALVDTLSSLPPALVETIARGVLTGNEAAPVSATPLSRWQPIEAGLLEVLTRMTKDARSSDSPGLPHSGAIRALARPAASRCASAVYLLNILLDLSAGELLWRACLPEARVLARAMREVIGDDAAIASALFDDEGDTPLPVITGEQQREIAAGLLTSLVEALERRKIAPRASVGWHGVTTSHDPGLFVAADGNRGDVLFAMPAATAREREQVAARFRSAWPGGSQPSGVMTPAPRLATHDSLHWSALLSQLAGTMSFLFAARAGQPFAPVAGEIIATPDLVDVRLPMAAIDLDVRRAGLDRDPGWIPWLQRRVIITFVEDPDGGEGWREDSGA